jgi:serine/threonine-protein kinase
MRCPACSARYDSASAFCALDGTRLVPVEDLGEDPLVGQVLADRYRIVRLLGEGGMGRVYEGAHVNINKRVAIKVLRPELVENAATVARFRQEARSASAIGHDNIVAMEDFATLPDGTVYLAMEYLDGESLGDRMRRPPPLPLAEGLATMAQVCRGLHAAHEQGIVHRDMKPENIFLAQKNTNTGKVVIPKILDFGIAKMSGQEGALNLTKTGAIFGTPLYMSPEQAKGEPLDHRADIYSTGVILYELATGRVPFKADSSVQVLAAHITSDPERPSRAAPDRGIPPSVEAAILRAMAKDPAARFPSAGELADELLRALAALSSSGQRSAALPPAPAAKRRTGLIAALAALLLVLAGGGVMLGLRRTPAPPMPVEAVHEAPPPAPLPPSAPQLEEVMVATLPPGAKIVRPGEPVLTSPDVVTVPAGATVEVVLKKDGFAERSVVVDPAKGHKILVKLDRPEPLAKPKSAAKPETLPDPYASAPPPKTSAPPPKTSAPPPKTSAPPSDAIAAAVERTAATAAPGAHRSAPFFAGQGEEGQHGDWFVPFEAGKCYTIVASGGPEVKMLYLYLWNPAGRRATERQEGRPNVVLQHCASTPGSYHFQVKVADGKGAFKAGVYAK